jgi:hypothetical protein
LNYVSVSPVTSPTFQTQLGGAIFIDSTDFFPLQTQTLTYSTPFVTDVPFLIVDTMSVLSGLPCSSQIVESNLTSFEAQIFSCPANGFVVSNVANTVLNPSLANFVVGTTSLPAVAYVYNTKLYYQLAQTIDGTFWNPQVFVANVPLNATLFKLVNYLGQPSLAWLDNTNNFYFARTTAPDFSTYAIGPITITPGYNVSTIVFDFFYINQQPAVVIQNSSNFNLYFYISSDSGTTWTSTLIVAATHMISVSATIVNSMPALIGVTNTNSLRYYRAATLTETPWSTAVTIYSSGISGNNISLQVLNSLPNSNLPSSYLPILWAYGEALASNGTYQFFLVADNINGTSWTVANAITVNSTDAQGLSSNGHMVVYNTNTLLMSYIDQTQQLQYLTVTSSNLSDAEQGNTLASPLDPNVLHTNTSSTMDLVNGSVAFVYVVAGKLLYFRPISSSPIFNTRYAITYSAIGSINT